MNAEDADRQLWSRLGEWRLHGSDVVGLVWGWEDRTKKEDERNIISLHNYSYVAPDLSELTMSAGTAKKTLLERHD